MSWLREVRTLSGLMEGLVFWDQAHQPVEVDTGFSSWSQLTHTLRSQERTLYLIGNGASASMASHFACDLAKNGHLHTQVFFDLSLLTAISNDIDYESVFAVPLQRRGRAGDMLVAISSSGRSPNILKASQLALELGMTLVTLSGFSPDNPLRKLGHLNAYVAADNYGWVETTHASVLHHWMDLVEVKS